MRALLLAALLSIACVPTDVGQCCQVTAGADPSIVPQPAFNSAGDPASVISTDPQLLCDNIACVSYQGSTAYCTHRCEFDSNCPAGFSCSAVINSDPGADTNTGPSDKFCVKTGHLCE